MSKKEERGSLWPDAGLFGLGILIMVFCAPTNIGRTKGPFNHFFWSSFFDKLNVSYLARGNTKTTKCPNFLTSRRAIALLGSRRSGVTTFLASSIFNETGPLLRWMLFPQCGLYLDGSLISKTHYRLLSDANTSIQSWDHLEELISTNLAEQTHRLFLLKTFKKRLPSFLRPVPVTIVIDNAEFLMRRHGESFLSEVKSLARKARDNPYLRLILVINTENAAESLRQLYDGGLFNVVAAPKVSRDAVVAEYGEDFAKVFDDCDSCIGIARDYASGTCEHMTAAQFTARVKEHDAAFGQLDRVISNVR